MFLFRKKNWRFRKKERKKENKREFNDKLMEQRGVLRIEIYGPPLFKNLIRHNKRKNEKQHKEDKK